ncbi:MAG: SRPBCC domain-containing protein [Carnobacterium sp.]|uniref:SRPBCC domain-containing protein n=1 Tax=Carnobacterium sp. TaxID=48221 RepID=UPI003314F949
MIPYKKIIESGVFNSDNPAFVEDMVMTWYFEEVDLGIKVTITAGNVPEDIKKEDYFEGLNSTLENLGRFVKNS